MPPAPPIPELTKPLPDNRFRPEEIGDFHGNSDDDVIRFTNRLTTIAATKGHRLIQTNLVVLLKGKAFKWYTDEITPGLKWTYDSATSIDPWCNALKKRFSLYRSELREQLKKMEYTKADVHTTDATEFIQDVLHITNQMGDTIIDSLDSAYNAFQAILRLNLPKPPKTSSFSLEDFMYDVSNAQVMWKQAYYPPRPPNHHHQSWAQDFQPIQTSRKGKPHESRHTSNT